MKLYCLEWVNNVKNNKYISVSEVVNGKFKPKGFNFEFTIQEQNRFLESYECAVLNQDESMMIEEIINGEVKVRYDLNRAIMAFKEYLGK